MGNHRAKGGFTLPDLFGGFLCPPEVIPLRYERKEGGKMITYQDLFLFCTFIVALISLFYQIYKDKRK